MRTRLTPRAIVRCKSSRRFKPTPQKRYMHTCSIRFALIAFICRAVSSHSDCNEVIERVERGMAVSKGACSWAYMHIKRQDKGRPLMRTHRRFRGNSKPHSWAGVFASMPCRPEETTLCVRTHAHRHENATLTINCSLSSVNSRENAYS